MIHTHQYLQSFITDMKFVLALACLLSLMGTTDAQITADQIQFNKMIPAPARFKFKRTVGTHDAYRYFKIKNDSKKGRRLKIYAGAAEPCPEEKCQFRKIWEAHKEDPDKLNEAAAGFKESIITCDKCEGNGCVIKCGSQKECVPVKTLSEPYTHAGAIRQVGSYKIEMQKGRGNSMCYKKIEMYFDESMFTERAVQAIRHYLDPKWNGEPLPPVPHLDQSHVEKKRKEVGMKSPKNMRRQPQVHKLKIHKGSALFPIAEADEKPKSPAAAASFSSSPSASDSGGYEIVTVNVPGGACGGNEIRRRLAPRGTLRRLSALEQLRRETTDLQ